MHESLFEEIKPTDTQIVRLATVRKAFAEIVRVVEAELLPGPDTTYVIRKLRECGMWADVAVTRLPDGAPRA